jgi:hypothetical protein
VIGARLAVPSGGAASRYLQTAESATAHTPSMQFE